MQSSPLASTSLRRHYVRGAVGLAALVAAVAGAALLTPAASALFIVCVGAWRGCPTCWAVGLLQTRERQQCASSACRTIASVSA